MSAGRFVPIEFYWDGQSMIPLDRFKYACRQYVEGEVYRLNIEEERSRASQGHYFASLKEAWKNLPEHVQVRFPDTEALRHWLLIKCGYCTTKTTVLETEADAKHFAAAASDWLEHVVIVVKGNVVIVYTAMSQSARSMNKKEFEESKKDVLDEAAALIDVSRKALEQNTGKSA